MPVENDNESPDLQPTRAKLLRTEDGSRSERLAPSSSPLAHNKLNEMSHPTPTTRDLIDMEDPSYIARIITDQIVTRVSNSIHKDGAMDY